MNTSSLRRGDFSPAFLNFCTTRSIFAEPDRFGVPFGDDVRHVVPLERVLDAAAR
jgi:hypothetical protein